MSLYHSTLYHIIQFWFISNCVTQCNSILYCTISRYIIALNCNSINIKFVCIELY